MRTVLLALAIALATAAPAAAAPALSKLGNFDRPLYVTSPPKDSRVFVVEKPGRIVIAGRGTFLDISSLVNSSGEEQGLLSMAFSPNYASNGLFYVDYTGKDGKVKVVEFKRSANPDRASASSARTIFAATHSASNHNGGQLQFGPDGMLYVSIGDNADGSNAHNLTNPFGKILRLNPATGGAAAGNPVHPESRIWAYGLRNPWRFSFDRTTGDIAIGDVGESAYEEIDWGAAPTRARDYDFGWDFCEGNSPNTGSCSGDVSPIITHTHGGDGFCAIIGGYVVRDPGLGRLNGRYVYSDNCKGKLYSAQPRTGNDDREEPVDIPAITSFGQDACGRIYLAALTGEVYRLHDGAATPCNYPAGGGSGPGPGGSGDTTKPTVNVAIRGLKRAVKKRRLFVRVRCSEACAASITTRLIKVKRLKTRHRNLAAGQRVTVTFKLTRQVANRLKRRVNRKGFVRVGVTVRATDHAGNTRVVRRYGRIKKPS